nr:U1 small nuclear ribonucleoprotein C [Cryptomonas curvata]
MICVKLVFSLKTNYLYFFILLIKNKIKIYFMYKCFYCKVLLFQSSQKVRKQHENGNRHKINVSVYIHNLYIKWICQAI